MEKPEKIPLGIPAAAVAVINAYNDKVAALDTKNGAEKSTEINWMPLALAASSMARNGESLSAGEKIKSDAAEIRYEAPEYITQTLLLEFAGDVVDAIKAQGKSAQR